MATPNVASRVIDFFTAGKQTQPAADNNGSNGNNNNQNQPGNQDSSNGQNKIQQTQQTPGVKPNTDPNNVENHTENPLDLYAKVFDNASKNSGIQAPVFTVDPKIVSEVAGKLDFTKDINPETIQKATNGDATAMMQLIQDVGRNSYRAAIEHTTKLTDTHLNARGEFESSRVATNVKSQLTSDALSSDANLNHPLVKKELNRIAESFAKSPEFADASPGQIAKAALEYFNDLHAVMNPKKPEVKKNPGDSDGQVDYMKYLTGDAS